MNVLMVISQFDPIIGGAERQAKLLARTLKDKKGIGVAIITGWWKLGTARKEIIDGIRVIRNFSCWGMFGIKGLRPLGAFVYMLSLGIYLLMHRREYDLIHVHQALYPAFISILVGRRLLGKPVLVKSGSSGMTGDVKWLRNFPSGKFQLSYMLKNMECLVAVSRITGREFEEIGFPAVKIHYIPNGVDPPLNENPLEEVTAQISTITRMSFEKGVDILLRAWASVVHARVNLRLRIIGDGPLRAQMEIFCECLGIRNWVEFVGSVKNVEDYYRSTDLFVLSSRTEGLPNALLEAMGYGIPCIATNVGGNGELLCIEGQTIPAGGHVIGKNGILVNPEDADALSKAIVLLARNRELRENLGRNARKHIEEKYSIDLIAEKYIDLYHHILKGI